MTDRTCSVEGCERSRRKRDWCASHYNQWRRTGCQPIPFRYTWATEKRCLVCGTTNWPDNGRRRHCSGRCEVLASRSRLHGNVKTEMACVDCGAVIDIAPQPGKRKIRSDSKRCADCAARRTFRVNRGGTASSIGILRQLGDLCGICRQPVRFDVKAPHPSAPSVDHIHPVTLGGGNDPDNVQLAHLSCNQRKHVRVGDEDYGRVERQRLYSLRRWRKLSQQIRLEEPGCRFCGAPAQCVDHIIGIEEGGPTWDRMNLQPLCRPCHNRKSQGEYYARCIEHHENGAA